MGDDIERIICVKNEVFVYKIPPRQSNRGYRAADWKLDQPDWTGRMRIINLNNNCIVKLEDKFTGELFAQAPIPLYPGPAVESVTDSSRYFVLKIEDEGGRHAFIGMGFTDRGDSFDFNVSLQDHFKREKNVDQITKEINQPEKHIDLGFKEGQTIKINFGNKTEKKATTPKSMGGGTGLLPPPPGGTMAAPKLTPPPSTNNSSIQMNQPPSQQPIQQQQSGNEWGDFASFSNSSTPTQQPADSTSTNWVQFR